MFQVGSLSEKMEKEDTNIANDVGPKMDSNFPIGKLDQRKIFHRESNQYHEFTQPFPHRDPEGATIPSDACRNIHQIPD